MELKQGDHERFSIMIIEDQPFVRRAVAQILRQIGFRRILEAENGEQGLRDCIASLPDLVVCDIEMQPVNGLEFLASLRSHKDAACSRIPVLFLTNHTESEIVKRAMKLGVNAFVVKPPSLNALKERIDRLLAGLPGG